MSKEALLRAMFEQCHSSGGGIINPTRRDNNREYFTILFPKGTHFHALIAAADGVQADGLEGNTSTHATFIFQHETKVDSGQFRKGSSPETIGKPVVHRLADGLNLLLQKTPNSEYVVRVYSNFITRDDFVTKFAAHEKTEHPPTKTSPLGSRVRTCDATRAYLVPPAPASAPAPGKG